MSNFCEFIHGQQRRIHSASSSRRKSSTNVYRNEVKTSKKDKKFDIYYESRPKESYFPGMEITNIFLLESKRTSLRKSQAFHEDEDYKPIDFSDYLKSNYEKILLDKSYEVLAINSSVVKTGKLRTGLTFSKKRNNLRSVSMSLNLRKK